MSHKAKTLQNLFSGRTGKENISSYTRYKEAFLIVFVHESIRINDTHVPVPFMIEIIIMNIMQLNTRTACTTTRRTVVKRGNAAAV